MERHFSVTPAGRLRRWWSKKLSSFSRRHGWLWLWLFTFSVRLQF